MNNYEYIIASLPVIRQESRSDEGLDSGVIIEDIRSLLSAKDALVLDFLLEGFTSEALCPEFYRKAFSHRNGFIREYFRYDFVLRTLRTEYLNAALGRPEGKDLMDMECRMEEDEAAGIRNVLSFENLLDREYGLDSLVWDKCEELVRMHYFDIDVILGFVARINIIRRWNVLDPEKGKARFRELVKEIRNNR